MNYSTTIVTIDGQVKTLSFGIELECIFAFKETLLGTNTTPNARTFGPVKNLPYELRALETDFNRSAREFHRAYNSWGFIQKSPIFVDEDHSEWPALVVIRPYGKEPLKLASQVLNQHCNLTFKVPTRDKVEDFQYDTWHVAPDTSVTGVGSTDLPKYLPDRIKVTESQYWDSFGIELISRVFEYGNAGDMQEIENVVKAIQGTSDSMYGAFNTNQTGFHVHVLSPDLAALKELAYLLLVYEEGINCINAPCRKPEHPVQAQGNLAFNTLIGDKDKQGKWEPDAGGFQEATTLLERRAKIEACRDVGELSMLIGADKSFYVVIMRADESLLKSTYTIEFRYHRGTLDYQTIRWWIEFCTGIVRLSVLYADTNTRCPISNYSETRNVFVLLDEMDFPEEGKKYYRERFFRYDHYPADAPLAANDFEITPTEPEASKNSPDSVMNVKILDKVDDETYAGWYCDNDEDNDNLHWVYAKWDVVRNEDKQVEEYIFDGESSLGSRDDEEDTKMKDSGGQESGNEGEDGQGIRMDDDDGDDVGGPEGDDKRNELSQHQLSSESSGDDQFDIKSPLKFPNPPDLDSHDSYNGSKRPKKPIIARGFKIYLRGGADKQDMMVRDKLLGREQDLRVFYYDPADWKIIPVSQRWGSKSGVGGIVAIAHSITQQHEEDWFDIKINFFPTFQNESDLVKELEKCCCEPDTDKIHPLFKNKAVRTQDWSDRELGAGLETFSQRYCIDPPFKLVQCGVPDNAEPGDTQTWAWRSGFVPNTEKLGNNVYVSFIKQDNGYHWYAMKRRE